MRLSDGNFSNPLRDLVFYVRVNKRLSSNRCPKVTFSFIGWISYPEPYQPNMKSLLQPLEDLMHITGQNTFNPYFKKLLALQVRFGIITQLVNQLINALTLSAFLLHSAISFWNLSMMRLKTTPGVKSRLTINNNHISKWCACRPSPTPPAESNGSCKTTWLFFLVVNRRVSSEIFALLHAVEVISQEGLQMKFGSNVLTNFWQQWCSNATQFIPMDWKTTAGTGKFWAYKVTE